MHESYIFLPLREMYTRLRNRSLKALDLVEASEFLFSKQRECYNAYKTWNSEKAMKVARATDAVFDVHGDAGPLMGFPVSIKDLYAVPGLPTYAGSSLQLPKKWEEPGPIITALLRQLPTIMGKTHTVEFAFGGLGTNSHWGTPRNPWDSVKHRTPGGSSSGAGVSLICGTACLAFGTDTAGSVRIPASMTGVAGLKITAGRWSTKQIVPLSPTLDSPGLLARSADDLVFSFTALDTNLSDKFKNTIPAHGLDGLVFGVPDKFFWDDCSPGIAEVVRYAIRQIEIAGARIVTLDLPRTEEAYALFKQGGLAAIELAAFLKKELPDIIDKLDSNIAARINTSDEMPAWEYVHRYQLINSLSASAANCLERVDALLTPTVVITPPVVESLNCEGAYPKANMLALRNTMIANFMGLCALTLPVGKDAAGMPVGMQVLCGPWQEKRLLSIGQAIEGKLGNSLAILGEPPILE